MKSNHHKYPMIHIVNQPMELTNKTDTFIFDREILPNSLHPISLSESSLLPIVKALSNSSLILK